MEPSSRVDLDSLLQSHTDFSDDSDNDDSTVALTIDEILLRHHSSSSPSPSPPPSPSTSYHNSISRSTPSTNNSKALNSHNLSHSVSNPDMLSSIKPETDPHPLSRAILPPLFGGGVGVIRSNSKPGDALAAAAAASRSVRTPHALAIKLRRSSIGSGGLRRFLDPASEESLSPSSAPSKCSDAGSDVCTDSEGVAAREVHNSNCEKVIEEDCQLEKIEVIQVRHTSEQYPEREYSNEDVHVVTCDSKVLMETTGKDETATSQKNEMGEVSARSLSDNGMGSQVESEKDMDLNRNYTNLDLIEITDNDDGRYSSLNDYGNVDAEIGDANEPIVDMESAFISSLISDDGIFHEDTTVVVGQEQGLSQLKDGKEIDPQNDAVYSDKDLVLPSQGGIESQRKQAKPLELAEELEKRHAFTGMHYVEGAAAQPMRLEGVGSSSTTLGYFDISAENTITKTILGLAFRRDNGSPQVVAVHLNYIAIGMSKGLIVIVPSKYSPQNVDNLDTKMSMLGLQGDRSHVPVTSMCFNQQGDLLFAGYGDGHYTVWDVQKTSALKVVTEHRAPVVHMLYLGQDSQVTRQFNVVSGDSKGVVKLIRFSVVPWLNRISYTKSTKLLDETTSRVVCASPLLSGEGNGGPLMSAQGSSAISTSGIGSMMGGGVVEEGVVIFVTHQSALVAKVSPSIEVYAQIPRPDGIREGAMPYAAWKYLTESEETVPADVSERVALLAIAWDRKVQVAKLVKSEIKIFERWTLDSPAVGVAWLDDQMLVVLTSTAQLFLFTKDGNMIHQTSISQNGHQGDDLISYHIYYSNTAEKPEKAHHNCVAVRGATVYILGPEHLIVCRLLPWKERIEVLRKAGDWLGALNMATTLYDGQAHGIIDLPRTLHGIQQSVVPYLVELLLSYVDEVFSYMSVACGNQTGKLDQSDEIKEQYIHVGGVAVEFCVHIRRTDILFDEIMSKFEEARQKETFLELLEPYILKDMLGSLPPGIMQALVEHYSRKGWLQRVEQCVLHMDILSLDFNQVVRLCREHRLHGALIYLFNKGLNDFRAPLEELLAVLRESERENADSIGYRILVYLKYCFEGLAFPPGRGNISPNRLPSLRKELLEFLLEDSSASSAWAVTGLPSNRTYPNLVHLLELDTEATLDVLRHAFFVEETPKSIFSPQQLPHMTRESFDANNLEAESQNLVQKLLDVLSVILDAAYFHTGFSSFEEDSRLVEIWPSNDNVGHLYEFMACYVACGRAKVSKDTLSKMLEFLISPSNLSPSMSGEKVESIKRRENLVLALLEVVPETDWDAPCLLHRSERAQFHKVCGLIHASRHEYVAALDSYMQARDEPVQVFSFVHDMLRKLNTEDYDAFESAVISRIPDLLKLSREGAFVLIVDHFSGRHQYIRSELGSHPESLFLYLKTVIEVHSAGTLNLSNLRESRTLEILSGSSASHHLDGVKDYLEMISDLPKRLHHISVPVTDEMMELYFELLCQYERESVVQFLETFENYRVEHCLRICQEHGIVDGAAFLLERVGDVGSALGLILSDLNDKFIMLNAVMNGDSGARVEHFDVVLNRREVKGIFDILHACIGLCQRNSPRLEPDESEYLWFQVLDSFCEPLLDPDIDKLGSRMERDTDSLSPSSQGIEEEEEGRKIRWSISKSHKGVCVMRKLFSVFIREIVEGMIGYVRLPRIMMKLLSDNGNQEFGDFKHTILGMLGTYDFERRILDTAKSLIEDDMYYTMRLLRKGASHGYAPRSPACCMCNCLLDKNSSESSIQVFSCGHSMHLYCENRESGAFFRDSSAGCPICMPTKKAQRSNGISMLAGYGMVNKSSSKTQQGYGTTPPHLHDHDTFENFGSYSASRFELLNKLQKDQKLSQIENLPPLRLAPPAIYHEKVKKVFDLLTGESSSRASNMERPSRRSRQLKDVKLKGPSVRFPLKSNIFGKEKMTKR